jgi:hypothetical protein
MTFLLDASVRAGAHYTPAHLLFVGDVRQKIGWSELDNSPRGRRFSQSDRSKSLDFGVVRNLPCTITMQSSPSIATMVGRTAAACVHPYAAWRVRPASVKVAVLSTYAVAAYVLVLTTLLALSTAH